MNTFMTSVFSRFQKKEDASSDPQEDDKNEDCVSLMTIHAAKGLEFKNVYVVGLEENLFPSQMALQSRAELEEERRLFYVGITRARERLWLTRGAARLDRGRGLPRAPSRFLDELPPDFIRPYEIAKQEELSSDAIGDMAAAFLAMSKPEEPAPTAKPRA